MATQLGSAIEQLNKRPEGKVFRITNFISGHFLSAEDELCIHSENPATGQIWAELPDSSEQDVGKAVDAAKTAFKGWSETSAQERARLLAKVADLVESRLDEFAHFESLDQGKPVHLAKAVDIPRCVANFRFFASVVGTQTNECVITKLPHVEALNYVQRRPIGVCGLISPWNLPLYLLSFKLAPALAFGNTVVAKPSEFTSVTAWLLAKAFVDAGFPPGVINIVFGGGRTGQAIVTNPDVAAISFTGSTATGERIASLTARSMKKVSLEMGGKNACIIMADADLDKHLDTIVRSCFANQGEICLCSSRLFVHKSIFDTFLHRFVAMVKTLKVGDPTHPTVFYGAMNSRQHYEKVIGFIAKASEEDAVIHCGDEEITGLPDTHRKGYYIRPTVLSGVADDSVLMQEEIFGPVVCLTPFSDEAEVVRRANDVKYGLAAAIFTNDAGAVHRVAQQLQTGYVWCNCWLVRDLTMPFGGVKASGVGREGPTDSREFFTETKTICIRTN